jgi:hypothetical protein
MDRWAETVGVSPCLVVACNNRHSGTECHLYCSVGLANCKHPIGTTTMVVGQHHQAETDDAIDCASPHPSKPRNDTLSMFGLDCFSLRGSVCMPLLVESLNGGSADRLKVTTVSRPLTILNDGTMGECWLIVRSVSWNCSPHVPCDRDLSRKIGLGAELCRQTNRNDQSRILRFGTALSSFCPRNDRDCIMSRIPSHRTGLGWTGLKNPRGGAMGKP